MIPITADFHVICADDRPLVSVIIPTKDRRFLLMEMIASVQSQTYRHWEAVVVDDDSQDDTWSALQEIATGDSRIRPLRRSGPTGGVTTARNQGFAASRGSFIVFLDSDDLLKPTALRLRVRSAQEHPEADAVVFGDEYFRNSPGEYSEECAHAVRLFESVDALDAFLTSRSPWTVSGPLWRRSTVHRVGLWDTQNPVFDDLAYHINALVIGVRFIRFPVVDQFIRHHPGSRVSGPGSGYKILEKMALLDRVIELLGVHELYTHRRKRMLAWFALTRALNCAFQPSGAGIQAALTLWRGARDRSLMSPPAYLAGFLLVHLQWSNILGPFPRELARLILYLDLKRQPIYRASFFRSAHDYVRWLLEHFRNWARARGARILTQS